MRSGTEKGLGFGVRNGDRGGEHETKQISEHEMHGETESGTGIAGVPWLLDSNWGVLEPTKLWCLGCIQNHQQSRP